MYLVHQVVNLKKQVQQKEQALIEKEKKVTYLEAVFSGSCWPGLSSSQSQFKCRVRLTWFVLSGHYNEGSTHPGQGFSLSLCESNSVSRANTLLVYMGRKLALHTTLYG